MPSSITTSKIKSSCTPTRENGLRVLVTGSAGFVGYHTSLRLKGRGDGVVGLDNFNEYYPSKLKRARASRLTSEGVHTVDSDLNNAKNLKATIDACEPTHVLHLAAQAGVRFGASNPHAYVHSNVASFVTLLEELRRQRETVPRLVIASSSSVYGLNTKVPFAEDDVTDSPASLYAATKKSDELLAHTYSHMYGFAITALRFFTVYGPYGRPDMAYFSFSRSMERGEPITIFQGPNGEELERDFTYIDDVVKGTVASLDNAPPNTPAGWLRVYNLGNSTPLNVTRMVSHLEAALGLKAKRVYKQLPGRGDMLKTHADVSRARAELGYEPSTPLSVGLQSFADWYNSFFRDRRNRFDYTPP